MAVEMSNDMKALLLYGRWISSWVQGRIKRRLEFLADNQMLRFVERMPGWDPPGTIWYINRDVGPVSDGDEPDDDMMLMPIVSDE